ncbi:MAG: hypothetical protein AAF065_03645 [Verrucomicrobiota bacterium]
MFVDPDGNGSAFTPAPTDQVYTTLFKVDLESVKVASGSYFSEDKRIDPIVLRNPQGVGEISMHARQGTTGATLESKASAQAVRNAWGSDIPPQILIIQIADAVTL